MEVKFMQGRKLHQSRQGRKLGFELWPTKSCPGESTCSERAWWTFHILPFVESECKRWNVISSAYPLLLQYNPMAPLSVCYSHTYWLWACCGVKRALVATFCPAVSLFKQWMDGFLKKTQLAIWNVKLYNVLRLYLRPCSCSKNFLNLIFHCLTVIYK